MTESADLLARPPDQDPPLAELLAALGDTPPWLPSKYFYDDRGARLFEQICTLPEYYPTRCELQILERYLPEMAEALGPACQVIEPGSGEGLKTRHLLQALHEPVAFLPIDVADEQLAEAAEALRADFPKLDVLPQHGDFTHLQSLPALGTARRRVFYFPGSTIGNFVPDQAAALLASWRALAGDNGALLIGVDLRKDKAIIEAAYNDAQGVTAAFNRNILRHLNRRFGCDFDEQAWSHRAFFDEPSGQIQMWLDADTEQLLTFPSGEAFSFAAGSSIRTEYSCKYAPAEFSALAGSAGWQWRKTWTDEAGWFGVMLFEAAA